MELTMPLPPFLAETVNHARTEIMNRVAHLSGRGADWIDESGHALANRTLTATAQLTAATNERAEQVAERLAGRAADAICRWTEALGDRMIRVGEDLTTPRNE